jgi:hypothetical protein
MPCLDPLTLDYLLSLQRDVRRAHTLELLEQAQQAQDMDDMVYAHHADRADWEANYR